MTRAKDETPAAELAPDNPINLALREELARIRVRRDELDREYARTERALAARLGLGVLELRRQRRQERGE